MLKLTVEAGEYLQIGDEVKVIFTGGNAGRTRVLIEAPKSVNIARSRAMEKHGLLENGEGKAIRRYDTDPEISDEAKKKIRAIIAEERRKAKEKNLTEKHIYTT